MNYKTIEQSLAGRTPIRLYTFKRGVQVWAYNSSSQAIKRGSTLYQSLPGGLSDKGIITSDGGISDNFTITAPADIEVARLFYGMPPSARLELTVANTHLQTDEVVPCWFGAVVSVRDKAINQAEIIASPLETLANRPGVSLVYSRQCGSVIYDNLCKVNKELYRVRTTAEQLNPTSVVTTAAANTEDGYFSGGFIEYATSGGELDRRYIDEHNGPYLVVWGGTSGISLGQAISIFPGCNGDPAVCANRYHNQLNRQSFDHLQGYSPFDGNQVF